MIPDTFIFDMDGVIIDSEPFWRIAQIEALKTLGVTITAKDCEIQTMGKRIDLVAKTWCDLFSLQIDPKDLETEILNKVVYNITQKGTAISGLTELLAYLKKENYKIGLATSSSWKIIETVLNKLNIKHYFNEICSADDEQYGKPNPAVYLTAMNKLNATPEESYILEDSVTGMIAAKASMAYTIVVTKDIQHPNFSIANKTCSSLQDVAQFLRQ